MTRNPFRPGGLPCLALLVLVGALVAGCATPRPTPAPETPDERPELTVPEPAEQVRLLLQEAEAAPESIRQALDAVLELDAPDPELLEQADALWHALDTEPRVQPADRVRGARIAAARDEWQTARERLGPDVPEGVPHTTEAYWQGLTLHAHLLEQERQWYQALDARLRLDPLLLLEPDAQTSNQIRIWELLSSLTPGQRTQLMRTGTPDAAGWAQLFTQLRDAQDQDAARQAAQRWHERHPIHPAQQRLPELIASHPLERSPAGATLVLLPLSGALAEQGNATLEGITRAYYEETGGQERLIVRDTRSDPDYAVELYRRGVTEGVDRVIGPLDREAVQAVAQVEETRPTILLNRARLNSNGAFSTLALNPEGDAQAVVEHAVRAGWHHPLVILPEGALGDRLYNAYQAALEAHDLRPRAVTRINIDSDDLNILIGNALGIEQSTSRIRQTARQTGLNLEGDPQIRGDADHLFVTGTARQMRQLVPHLHFHGAGGLPMLATPHLYEGRPNPNRDRDLNGIMFPDVPLLFDASFDADDSLLRFVALGMDAMRLALYAPAAREAPHHRISGGAGTWSLNPVTHEWIREPTWARFESGEPQRLNNAGDGV